ncbi:MAG: response regulator, partial [Flavobacteriales bacterium]|nr:response regulator [Flavobacteriales bacterium]
MQVVYCIDDNEMIVKMLSYQLEKFFDPKCFVVEGHSCPLKAIEAIRTNYSNGFPPIVCIVDFQMPQMNGDEFIKIIRSEFPMSKALMLSG